MNFQPKTKWHKTVALLLTAGLCFCFFLLGAYAAEPTGPFLQPGSFSEQDNAHRKGTVYTFTQNSFYCDGYIIEMGWNLTPEYISKYAQNDTISNIQLANGEEMPTLFAKAATPYIDNQAVRQAIAKLISQQQQVEYQLKIKLPYIVQVIPAPPAQHAKLAEEFYQNGELSPFAALFPQLDSNAQAAYWQRIYANQQISFWACTVEYMPPELLRQYLAQSEEDDRIAYFSIILDYLPQEDFSQLAEKFYQADRIAFFSILTGYMSDEEMAKWQKRAVADQKIDFASMLGVEPDWDKNWEDYWNNFDDFWNDLEKDLEKNQNE